MEDITKVVIDAMGGDYAPNSIVQGAVEASNENDNVHIFLVGKEELINSELAKYDYDKSKLEVLIIIWKKSLSYWPPST